MKNPAPVLDKKKFLASLAQLAATYRVEMDQTMIEGYWIALCDIQTDAFVAACIESLKSSEFFPRPAEIRRRAKAKRQNAKAIAEYNQAKEESRDRAWKELGPVKVNGVFEKLLKGRKP